MLITKMESNPNHSKHSLEKAILNLDLEDSKTHLSILITFLIKLPEDKLPQKDQIHALCLILNFRIDFNVKTVKESPT